MIVAAFAAIRPPMRPAALTSASSRVSSPLLLAAVLALFNLRFRAHIFIAGIAVTFLAYGLTALLLKSMLGQDGVFASTRIPAFP